MNNRFQLKFIVSALVCISTLMVFSCRTSKVKNSKKMSYITKAFVEIKNAIPEAQVVQLEDTIKVLFPSNIMFATNSASLDSQIAKPMSRFAGILNKYNQTSILISGYTDNVGTDEYNDVLSAQRADSAKANLVQNQVLATRINTWGMGKRHPIASNETEEGRALNRRVEFVILYEKKK